jgi:hypothetical protein
MKKESTAPHARLAYNHLQASFAKIIAEFNRVTAAPRGVNEIGVDRV